MTETNNNSSTHYWWLWTLLFNWKLLIFGSLIVGIIGLGISFVLPKWYRAEAEIMPYYQSSGGLGSFADLASGILTMGGGGGDYVLPMMTTPSDLWGALAKSNAMVDTLIVQYDLGNRYDIKKHKDLRDVVREHMDTEVTGEGILVIGYEDKNPKIAAMIANSIVDYLDNVNRELRSGSAGATRKFIEERLHETALSLAEAESSFASFQKEYGAISLEDQTRVAIENAAQLRAELLIAEVEMAMLSSSRKYIHGEVQDVQSRINTIKKQLKEIKSGTGFEEPFGLDDIPDLGIRYARLYRDLTIEELLYQYLVQQYEQSRIEEMKDTPILQILSRARVPDYKDRPKRAVIAVLTTISAFIILSIWVILSSALTKMRIENPDSYEKLTTALGGKKRKETE